MASTLNNDFEEGGVIYVRGRKATCKRTDDYPLIFWAYDDNPSAIYHRSLKDDADMFSLYPPETDSKTELKDETYGTLTDSPDPASSEAVGSQPPKTTYENLEDDIVACDVQAPGAVHIEKCSQTTFTLDNQVSSITLVGCNDVTVNFLSVISTCDVLQSSNCQILCKEQCTSFTLEDCEKINITFPNKDVAESSEVKVITRKCNDITLVAKADPYSDGEDVRYKVRRTSVSVAEKYQTKLKNGKFETEEWKDATRSGEKEEKGSEEKKSSKVEGKEKKREKKSKVTGDGVAKGLSDVSSDPGGSDYKEATAGIGDPGGGDHKEATPGITTVAMGQ